MDAEGNLLHEHNKVELSQNRKEKLFVVEKVKKCAMCGTRMVNGEVSFNRAGQYKKLVVRCCEKCNRKYVSLKFYNSGGFPVECFVVEHI